jgi:hypothetical protein
MRGHLQGVVQASGATIFPEHGSEAAVLGSLANLGTLGLLRQMESWPVRP